VPSCSGWQGGWTSAWFRCDFFVLAELLLADSRDHSVLPFQGSDTCDAKRAVAGSLTFQTTTVKTETSESSGSSGGGGTRGSAPNDEPGASKIDEACRLSQKVRDYEDLIPDLHLQIESLRQELQQERERCAALEARHSDQRQKLKANVLTAQQTVADLTSQNNRLKERLQVCGVVQSFAILPLLLGVRPFLRYVYIYIYITAPQAPDPLCTLT